MIRVLWSDIVIGLADTGAVEEAAVGEVAVGEVAIEDWLFLEQGKGQMEKLVKAYGVSGWILVTLIKSRCSSFGDKSREE